MYIYKNIQTDIYCNSSCRSLIMHEIWVPNSSVKDVDHKTVCTCDLFIEVKACIEPTTPFGWADNRIMVQLCVTVS